MSTLRGRMLQSRVATAVPAASVAVVQRREYRATTGKEWEVQRRRVLIRDGFMCQHPGCQVMSQSNHVDHMDDDAHKVVSDDRLQTLCPSHHTRKTRRDTNGYGREGVS